MTHNVKSELRRSMDAIHFSGDDKERMVALLMSAEAPRQRRSGKKLLLLALAATLVVVLQATLFGIAYLMKAVLKLQSNGTMQLGAAVGKTGEVYIPIPPKGKGRGKINIIVQDKYVELDAVTNSEETLKTGETVRVVSTDEMGLVMVERAMK